MIIKDQRGYYYEDRRKMKLQPIHDHTKKECINCSKDPEVVVQWSSKYGEEHQCYYNFLCKDCLVDVLYDRWKKNPTSLADVKEIIVISSIDKGKMIFMNDYDAATDYITVYNSKFIKVGYIVYNVLNDKFKYEHANTTSIDGDELEQIHNKLISLDSKK